MRANLPIADQSTAGEHPRGSWFERLAIWTSRLTGRPFTFLIAVGVVLVWAISGPIFKYSDTWQLVINTGTTIVTFLMVFLIQATQNRDTLALHLKLNELIVATKHARNHFAGIENAPERELQKRRDQFSDPENKPSKAIQSKADRI